MYITKCYIDRMKKETPFGAALRHYRSKEKGLTQAKLAKEMNVSQATITKIENGSMGGGHELRESLTRRFRVPYDDFLAKGKEIIKPSNIIPYNNVLEKFQNKPQAESLIAALAEIETHDPHGFSLISGMIHHCHDELKKRACEKKEC